MSLPVSPSFVILALSLALSGCFGVPVSSLPRLMRLDFLAMDFGQVRAGLRLPANLAVRPGDAVMTIKTRTDGGAETADRFVLVEAMEPAERASMAAEAKPGFTLGVFRIAPSDVPRLAELQARIRASQQQGPRLRGSIDIRVSGGCLRGAVADGPLPVSSYLKPARDEGFITLSQDVDLRQMIPSSDWAERMPRCPG